jgi:hypothetical protein
MRTKEVVVILLIFILFTSIVLTTSTNKVYGKDDDRRCFPSEYHDYQHVICSNGVWYPEGTDCKVPLVNSYEEWHNIGEVVKKDNDKKLREAYHKEHPPVTREQADSQCGNFDSENYQANKEKCDLLYKDVERNEAGDHWLGGVTPDEDPDADKESDLGYNELCDYNGGKWKDNKCEFDDDDKEKKYENKLFAYHDTNPEKLKEKLDKQDKGQFEVVRCDDGIMYDRDSTTCDEEGDGYEFVICNGVEYPKGIECEDVKNNLE